MTIYGVILCLFKTFFHIYTASTSHRTATTIRAGTIIAAMDSTLTAYSPEHDLKFARLFVLYLMENLFYGTSSISLHVAYIKTVVGLDFDCTIIYDWATHIHAYLYKCSDGVHM